MRLIWSLIPWLLALGSCTSPPTAPTVDEATRRPANSMPGIELQACKNELQNTRIAATESDRLAEASAMNLELLLARRRSNAASQPTAPANEVFEVHFAFGRTSVDIPESLSTALLAAARSAPLIVLRGRTDGTSDVIAESQVARQRAEAVRDYLVHMGIDPSRIRSTYQPSGDQVADNASAAGRRLNRRVEIEVYRALPIASSPQ